MFNDYSDYDFVPTQKQVDEVRSYYEKNLAQIKELKMYNDMLVGKYLKIIKGQFTVPFVFDKKFYNNCIKYFKDKDKEGKQNFEYLRDTLKDYISKDLKIVDILIMGYEFYGCGVRFKLGDDEYELEIPIVGNLSEHIVRYDDYVDWDKGKFRLLKKTSEHSWSTIWCDYDFEKIRGVIC